MLDNNLLDALPGFLLKMVSLETVHRHGNHNYFKSTFMWYHTDVNERILPVQPVAEYIRREPDKLQFWAAKAVIGSKLNFFADCRVAPLLKDYIANIYRLLIVCGHCNIAKLCNQQGESYSIILVCVLALESIELNVGFCWVSDYVMLFNNIIGTKMIDSVQENTYYYIVFWILAENAKNWS